MVDFGATFRKRRGKGAKIVSPPADDSDPDRALWENVKRTISPLRGRKAHRKTGAEALAKIKKDTVAANKKKRAAKLQTQPVSQINPSHQTKSGAAEKKPSAPPIPENLGSHRRVRRGQVETHARVDLHGKRHDEARNYLLQRLWLHQQDGLRCVLVITGRGERDQGVLRTSLPIWLQETSFRAVVSGIAPAHTRHGGKGAWYIFLRRERR